MTSLAAAKETAIKDMETMIKDAQEQLERHRKDLLKDILDCFNVQKNCLLDKQKQFQEVREMLNKNITQARDLTKIGKLRKLRPISKSLMKINEKTLSISSNLDLGQNYLAFDSKKGLDELGKTLDTLGRIYSKGSLPSIVVFGSTEATTDYKATVTVEVYDHHGDKFKISQDTFSVQVTDPKGTEVHVDLCTTGTECTVAFTPEMSGLHKVSGMFLGQRLINEETHITVDSNDPVLKFGEKGNGNGSFKDPWGIVIDDENCLYVADTSNRLIQKFTADGEFLSQFSVALHNKDYTTVDMTLDLGKGLLYCMEITDRNNTLSIGKNILVFNLKGELQYTYTPNQISQVYCLAINKQGELILSDAGAGYLLKSDKKGNFLSCIGDLKFPGYIAINEDDSIIVSDNDSDCIYIFNPDGSVRHKFGSSGTGMGQVKEPWGVATDGEYILVSEGGNNRIQVFKNDGTFVSMITSSDDPLSEPRGLAVTKDGHVYVVDRNNHCIKKYKYKNVNQ